MVRVDQVTLPALGSEIKAKKSHGQVTWAYWDKSSKKWDYHGFFLKKVLSSINGIIIYKWDYLYINLTPQKNESDICGAKLDQNGVESSRLGVKHLITILLMGKEIM